MTNKIKRFFLIIILLCSSTFVSSGNFEKIINFSKNNYGTLMLGSSLIIFLAHSFYNKKWVTETCIMKINDNNDVSLQIPKYLTWKEAIANAFPINCMKNTGYGDGIFKASLAISILGNSFIAVNYFSNGKFEFLNNHAKLIQEITKTSGAISIPCVMAL